MLAKNTNKALEKLVFSSSVFMRVLLIAFVMIQWGAVSVRAETVTAIRSTGAGPNYVVVNPITNKTYVVNSTDVTVVDGFTNSTTTVAIGKNLGGVALNTATNKIYVTNPSDNSVTVIDGATNNTTTVAVGFYPLAIAVNPVTDKIYVANSNISSNSVTVIDGATNNTSSVVVGVRPTAIAVNPVTNKIYVGNYGDNSVTVIDGATNATATVSGVLSPNAIAVNPVTNKIYVSSKDNKSVTVINGDSKTILTTVGTGTWPYAVAVNSITNKIYVPNYAENTVTVIDGGNNSTSTMVVGPNPAGVAVDSNNNKIYVSSSSQQNITVINGDTNATSIVAVGQRPRGVGINPITSKIYVANNMDNTVTVLDGDNNNTASTNTTTTTTTSMPTGLGPCAVAVNSSTNKTYVVNKESNTVTVIDEATNSTDTVATAGKPYAVALNPITNKIYVTSGASNTVTVIDGVTNSTTSVDIGAASYAVAVNPSTNKIYVADWLASTVTVIDGVTNSTAKVTVESSPFELAVNPITNKIYVLCGSSDKVMVIDGASNTTSTVTVGSDSRAVAVNASTNKIYVTNLSTNTVTVIDGDTNSTTTVAVWGGPGAVAVNSVTNKIYVASYNGNIVTVIDGATKSTTSVAVGTNPWSVVVNPSTNKVYVTNEVSNNVTIIDGTTNSTTTVAAGSVPRAVAVNPNTNKVYVTNTASNNVTIIGEQLLQVTYPNVTISPLPFGFVSNTPTLNVNAMGAGVWYQVDTPAGQWQKASATGSSASVALGTLSLGAHTLFVIGIDASTTINSGFANSPAISKIAAYTFNVVNTPTIDILSLPTGILKGSYSSMVNAQYGLYPYTWSALGLPEGLSINSTTGEVYGYPQTTGIFNPLITVVDRFGSTFSKTISIKIDSTPDGNGTLTAVPSSTAAGKAIDSIVFKYSLSQGGMVNGAVTIEVPGGWTMPTTVSGSPGYVTSDKGTLSISGQTITVSDVSMQEGDSLNITYNGASALSSGKYTFIAKAKTTSAGTLTGLAVPNLPTIILGADSTAPTWDMDALLTVTNKTVNGFTLTWPLASDDIGVTAYQIYSDESLLASVAGNISSYSVAGLAPGESHTYKLKAVDATGNVASGPTLAVNSNTLMTVGIEKMPKGAVGQPYSFELSASGGSVPYSFNASGLPIGLAINSANGHINGTALYAGSSTVTATVYDSINQQVHITFNIDIEGAVMPDTIAPTWPTGAALTVSNQSLNALTINWPEAADNVGVVGYNIYKDNSLVSTVAGAVYSSSIAGLTAGVSYSFGVKAFDYAGNESSLLAVTTSTNSSMDIDISGVIAAIVGSPYSASIKTIGGKGPYTFSATGLPLGLLINPSTGMITGMPSVAGNSIVNVTVTDSNGSSSSKSLSMTVLYAVGTGKYALTPVSDTAYTVVATADGICTLTVNNGVSGFKYFNVNIAVIQSHAGNETVVFVHLRNGAQIGINATKAEFDQVNSAVAAFNVQPGDVIKAYVVDDLTNNAGSNPTLLQ